MTQSKHTQGPWHRNIKAKGKYPVVFAGRNQHVAVTAQQEDSNETEANIDLIAAAPELLTNLKQCVVCLSVIDSENPAIKMAEKAIAKAEGK